MDGDAILFVILSGGFSISITPDAATQVRRLLDFTTADFPHLDESHRMDHDSSSSGHTNTKA